MRGRARSTVAPTSSSHDTSVRSLRRFSPRNTYSGLGRRGTALADVMVMSRFKVRILLVVFSSVIGCGTTAGKAGTAGNDGGAEARRDGPAACNTLDQSVCDERADCERASCHGCGDVLISVCIGAGDPLLCPAPSCAPANACHGLDAATCRSTPGCEAAECPVCEGGSSFLCLGPGYGFAVECPAETCATDASPPSSEADAIDAVTADTAPNAAVADAGSGSRG